MGSVVVKDVPEDTTVMETLLNQKYLIMNSWPSFTKHESKIAQKIIASSKVNYWTEMKVNYLKQSFQNG